MQIMMPCFSKGKLVKSHPQTSFSLAVCLQKSRVYRRRKKAGACSGEGRGPRVLVRSLRGLHGLCKPGAWFTTSGRNFLLWTGSPRHPGHTSCFLCFCKSAHKGGWEKVKKEKGSCVKLYQDCSLRVLCLACLSAFSGGLTYWVQSFYSSFFPFLLRWNSHMWY